MSSLTVQIVAIVGGLMTAALAIASQKLVTSFAAYLLIKRKRIFAPGDRIKIGALRGDVLALGFLHTRLLEIGQPQEVNEQESPGMWVKARQFSGRIITLTNDKVFDDAVYNLTHEFPFLWEEIHLPVPYQTDHARAEPILLDAAIAATKDVCDAARPAIRAFNEKYGAAMEQPDPRVYWRITDNWLEMTVRFIVPERGARDIKDRMARQIVRGLADARIDVASATLEITGLPPLRVQRQAPAARS